MALPLLRRCGRRRTALAATVMLTALALVADAPAARADGIFVADCAFSHRAADDPIVFHGRPRWSHMHDFFGNGSTDASSTLKSLRRSSGNCVPARGRVGLLGAHALSARPGGEAEPLPGLLPGLLSVRPGAAVPARAAGRGRQANGEEAAAGGRSVDLSGRPRPGRPQDPLVRVQVRNVADHVPGLLGRPAARQSESPGAHGLQRRRHDGAGPAALPRQPSHSRAAASAQRRLPDPRRDGRDDRQRLGPDGARRLLQRLEAVGPTGPGSTTSSTAAKPAMTSSAARPSAPRIPSR